MTTIAFDGTCVKELRCKDFENDPFWELKDKRCAFVLFYADWCGHCQDFKPEYINFANKAQFIHVYAFNTGKEETFFEKFGNDPNNPVKIQGFPTVWKYCCGKPVEEYEDDRTLSALIKSAQELCDEKCHCEEV